MIYRSGYKGVGIASRVRVTVTLKEMDKSGQRYQRSKSMSYTLDSRPDLEGMARKVDAAMMEENFNE